MRIRLLWLLVLTGLLVAGISADRYAWGFYAHRLINRMAVYTLPVEMLYLYKPGIAYLESHAVDADMRRYAIHAEGVRHYIDLDAYEKRPPQHFLEALASNTSLIFFNPSTDTMQRLDFHDIMAGERDRTNAIDSQNLRAQWTSFIRSTYYSNWEEEVKVSKDSLPEFVRNYIPWQVEIHMVESISDHGILPWHLQRMIHRLEYAFSHSEKENILRISADLGHYIADAHVPLHTTQNYNGQLTGQDGIHAFWESRIPELMAEEHFDFVVGNAKYVEDPASFFRNIIFESHESVDSVLGIEKRLSAQYPVIGQYCLHERIGQTTRMECPDYIIAYNDRLNGMVERRMRAAIHAIGSVWYTAWVNAGKPKLNSNELMMATGDEKELDGKAETIGSKPLGRNHDN